MTGDRELPSSVTTIAEKLAGEMAAMGIGPEHDVCYPSAHTLMRDMIAWGFEARVFELKGFRGSLVRSHPRWTQLLTATKQDGSILTHYVTVVDGFAIDLTFRQFDMDAPAVRITSLDDLRREWASSAEL